MSQSNLQLSSDFDVYQNFESYGLEVVLSGTVVGGGTRVYSSIAVSSDNLPEFSTFVSWGGTTTPASGPTYMASGFLSISANDGTLSDGSTGVGYSMRPRVSVSGVTVSADVEILNPYSLNLSVPSRTFSFRIRAYTPPTN